MAKETVLILIVVVFICSYLLGRIQEKIYNIRHEKQALSRFRLLDPMVIPDDCEDVQSDKSKARNNEGRKIQA